MNFIEIHPENVNTAVTTGRSIQDLVHPRRGFDLPGETFEVELACTTRARAELRVGDGECGTVATVAVQLTKKAQSCLSRALWSFDGLRGRGYLRVLIKA